MSWSSKKGESPAVYRARAHSFSAGLFSWIDKYLKNNP